MWTAEEGVTWSVDDWQPEEAWKSALIEVSLWNRVCVWAFFKHSQESWRVKNARKSSMKFWRLQRLIESAKWQLKQFNDCELRVQQRHWKKPSQASLKLLFFREASAYGPKSTWKISPVLYKFSPGNSRDSTAL